MNPTWKDCFYYVVGMAAAISLSGLGVYLIYLGLKGV